MALIVVAVFTVLRKANALTIAFAVTGFSGFFWLTTLLWLSGADYLTRPQVPPTTLQ